MKRLLIICGMAAVLLVPAALAGRSQPLGWISTNDYSTTVAVAQQPGVTNPSAAAYTYPYPATPPCGWAASDRWIRETLLNSSLPAGGSASDSLCLIQDWAQRYALVKMVSASPLQVRVTTDTGFSYTVPAAPYSATRGFSASYTACVPLPTFAPGDPALVEVTGSNGGVGVATTLTLTVTNSGKSQNVSGYWGYVAGC